MGNMFLYEVPNLTQNASVFAQQVSSMPHFFAKISKSSFAKSYLGEEDMVTIPWMPTAVHRNSVFLGRREQVEDIQVLNKLSITHVLSIGR